MEPKRGFKSANVLMGAVTFVVICCFYNATPNIV